MRGLVLGVRRRRLLSAMTAIAFCLSAVFGLLVASSSDSAVAAPRDGPASTSAASIRVMALTAHDPILIEGNVGFAGPNSTTGVTTGSGTADDPYVIADWDINASAANGIEIRNSDVYFIVSECRISGGELNYHYGIYLLNCRNGVLNRNFCSDNYGGIALSSLSNNNTLSNNNCSSNQVDGIFLQDSDDNTLNDNICSNEIHGIALESSGNNALINNTCVSDRIHGIALGISSNNDTLINNICSNGGTGIALWSSSNGNTLTRNSCTNNVGGGITLSSLSNNNTLSNNNCSSNLANGIGITGQNNSLSNNTCKSNSYHGIYLLKSSNNELNHNDCSNNNDSGIFIESSGNGNTLINNDCSNNNRYGILILPSNDVILANNVCSGNLHGIIAFVSDSILSNNNCSSNEAYGIGLEESSHNELDENDCSYNYLGIVLHLSSNNNIVWNKLCGNSGDPDYLGYGICVFSGSGNKIWNNTFIGNNNASSSYDPSHIQAFDAGTDNWWNSTDGYGNYWSDWTTPDNDSDGIVDEPYVIDGIAGSRDYYPLTTPQAPIPEFGLMPLMAIMLLVAILSTIGARRRKTS